MKVIIKYLLFFILTTSFSQTGKVTYKLSSLKTDKLDNSMVKGFVSEIENMEATLYYNREKSVFKLNKGIPINGSNYNLAKVFTEVYTDWFQDLLLKEAIFNKDIKGNTYQVILKRLDDWIITEETKKIQGYTCYKAIRKELNETSRSREKKYMTFIAWFTPEIPIGYGPVGNGGLPGLILRLERPNLLAFTATKILLNTKKNKIPSPKKGKKISMKERTILMLKERKVTVD